MTKYVAVDVCCSQPRSEKLPIAVGSGKAEMHYCSKAKISECLDKDRLSMSSALLRLRAHRGRENEKTVRAGGWEKCSELLLPDTPWLLHM